MIAPSAEDLRVFGIGPALYVRRLHHLEDDLIRIVKIAGEPALVDPGRDQVRWGEEPNPGVRQPTISGLDVIDTDGKVGRARVTDPDIAAGPSRRDELEQFKVVGR